MDTDVTLYALLQGQGVEPNLNRLQVLTVLEGSQHPMTAKEVLDTILESRKVDRVTIYRILDLLVDKGVLNRVSTGVGAASYCLRESGKNDGHSHFHCTVCGKVQCIDNNTLNIDKDALISAIPLRVSNVDLRLDGICEECSQS